MSSATRWATRCNACGTSFRVQEEQLQASDGYVRCGRCDAVFNARSTLFDLDAPVAAPGASTPSPTSTPRETAPEPEGSSDEPAAHLTAAAHERAPSDGSLTRLAPPDPVADEPSIEERTDLGLRPTDLVRTPDTLAGLPAQEPSEPVWRDAEQPAPLDEVRNEPDWREPDASRMLELLGSEPAAAAGASSTGSAAPATWKSLRERPAKKPQSRLALASLSLLAAFLVLALPVHWAWIEREPLRARHAELDQWLADRAALPSSGWRHLEGLQVSASSLRATPQGGAYQLELVVLNRATHRLAMPWLDLALSDAKGQPVLRRALDPALLGPSQALASGEQRRLHIVFRVDRSAPVKGYEIGLFHP